MINFCLLPADYLAVIRGEAIGDNNFTAPQLTWMINKRAMVLDAGMALIENGPASEDAIFQLQGIFHDAWLCWNEKLGPRPARHAMALEVLRADFGVLKEVLAKTAMVIADSNGEPMMSEALIEASCRGLAQLAWLDEIDKIPPIFWRVAHDKDASRNWNAAQASKRKKEAEEWARKTTLSICPFKKKSRANAS